MDAATKRAVRIPAREVELAGDLVVPPRAIGVVVFAHGSGSSRLSSRNRYVAEVLQRSGIATLLMDLLTPEEEEAERYTRHLRFNIPLLAGRLGQAINWLGREPDLKDLPIGTFGASTGAAARVVVAASVIAPSTLERLKQVADDVVYLDAHDYFYAIGQFYEDFSPVSDAEVKLILGRHRLAAKP